MNNSIFGKTIENVRKRVNINLYTDPKKISRIASKPTYVNSKIFNENLVAIETIKETLLLDKPCYVGMSILDLSKYHMFNFHYNYMKKKFAEGIKVLATDTDSLIYEIQCEDAYASLFSKKEDKDMFDNCDYPTTSPYFFEDNKKVIGKFKDETCGNPITEFVGLKSKMYSFLTSTTRNARTTQSSTRVAKGVKKMF